MIAVIAMVAGAVGVVGMLSVVTTLIIGRAVGGSAVPSAAGSGSIDVTTTPVTTPVRSAPHSPLPFPHPTTESHGTEI
jgi:hypothetical protein